MKKESFKNLVNRQIKALANEYLISLRSRHSKSDKLLHTNCMKEYLKSEKITVEEKKLLFLMKTRGVNVKTNFKNNFSNMLCRLCEKQGEDQSEIHLIKCEQIINENNIKDLIQNITYTDIFGKLDKQIAAIKAWKKVFRVWNIKLNISKLSPSGHQVHQPSGQSASCTLNATANQNVDTTSHDDNSNSNVYCI